MTTVYLIRHAESEGNVNRHLVGGQSNHMPLTERGQDQAHRLGERLQREGLRFTSLHSSTARRARDTMSLVAPYLGFSDADIITSADILEVSQGAWEGQLRAKVYSEQTRAQYLADPLNFKPPGGESVREVQGRMARWLRQLVPAPGSPAGPQSLAAVTHGYALRCLLIHLLGGDPAMARRMVTHNTSITVLQHQDGQWLLERTNDFGHLVGQELIGHYS